MEEIYETKQLNIAAYLYASGLPYVGNTKTGRNYFFRFQDKERAEKLVQQYFTDKASVNPRELFARLNALRDIIFNTERIYS